MISDQFISDNYPRILVTGITSIHGWPVWCALTHRLPAAHLRGIRPPQMSIPDAPNVAGICISDAKAVAGFTKGFSPTHVVHCAGVCNLDVCEERPAWAHRLNTGGAQTVVDLFGQTAHLLFLSTDLIFSGNHPPKGGYTEAHAPDPISVAGKTFRDAERSIESCVRWTIVRLGLPVGDSITGTKGAQDWIEHRFKRGLPVTLFRDEFRSCISCDEIARMSLAMIHTGHTGLYHFGGPDPVSLYGLGRSILARGNYPPTLLTGILRHQERNGPPRIGNVSLNSGKIAELEIGTDQVLARYP